MSLVSYDSLSEYKNNSVYVAVIKPKIFAKISLPGGIILYLNIIIFSSSESMY